MSLFKNHTAAHSSWCFRGRKKTCIHYHAWKIKKDPVGFFLPLSACSTWSWAEISPMCAGRPTRTYWRHWRGSCLKWALCISITGNGEKKLTCQVTGPVCLSTESIQLKRLFIWATPKCFRVLLFTSPWSMSVFVGESQGSMNGPIVPGNSSSAPSHAVWYWGHRLQGTSTNLQA